jgi:hypothetical protein
MLVKWDQGSASLSSATNVTLATVASLDRSLVSLFSAAHWDGPFSVTYFARNHTEREMLRLFVAQTLVPFCRKRGQDLRVSVVFDCVGAHAGLFPVNTLRRNAVAAAVTELVLYVDVDFIPSKSALRYITEYFAGQYFTESSSRQVMVLPCFMTQPSSTWPAMYVGNDSTQGPTVIREDLTKGRLLKEVAASQAMMPGPPLHSHGATNYHFWSGLPEAAPVYAVDYTLWYEPYFVINTSSWQGINGQGLFDENFFFGGGDKAQLSYEIASLGYTFNVHPAIFLVHVPQTLLKSHACNSRALSATFCDAFEVARNQTFNHKMFDDDDDVLWNGRQMARSLFVLWQGLARFMMRLPAWSVSTPLPAVLCFQPPLACLRHLPLSTVANLIMGNYFNTIPSRVTDVVTRLQPQLLAVANTNVTRSEGCVPSNGTETKKLHGKVWCTSREAAAPETVRADLWNACFGGYACEGHYIRGGDITGRDGMIVVDRRLLEGFNPGTLDLNGGYRLSGRIPSHFEHEILQNNATLKLKPLSTANVRCSGKEGHDYREAGQDNRLVAECNNRREAVDSAHEANSNELALTFGPYDSAQRGEGDELDVGVAEAEETVDTGAEGEEERYRSSWHASATDQVGMPALVRCQLLTSVFSARGILKSKVQRDLWVSFLVSDSPSRHPIPHVLRVWCTPT